MTGTRSYKTMHPTTFRLSPEAKRLLRLISADRGIDMTAVLESLLREEAKRTKLPGRATIDQDAQTAP